MEIAEAEGKEPLTLDVYAEEGHVKGMSDFYIAIYYGRHQCVVYNEYDKFRDVSQPPAP